MNKIKLYFQTAFFLLFCAKTQILAQKKFLLGVEAKCNMVAETYYHVPKGAESLFTFNIFTPGVSFWLEEYPDRALSGILRLNMVRKGFNDFVFFPFDQNRAGFLTKNRFDYFDMDIMWRLNLKNKFVPQMYAGLRFGMKIYQKVDSRYASGEIASTLGIPPHKVRRFAGGSIIGFKYNLARHIQVGIEHNIDIAPVIDLHRFRARNFIFSFYVAYTMVR